MWVWEVRGEPGEHEEGAGDCQTGRRLRDVGGNAALRLGPGSFLPLPASERIFLSCSTYATRRQDMASRRKQ